jgi:uncharacterized repeat protein (TIGR01451 family)
VLTLAVVLGLLALAPASALAARDFALRFTASPAGAMTHASNTLLTCPDAAPLCAAGRAGTGGSAADDNNDFAMTYVDVDNDPATFASSSAQLTLPAGASVLFAGLYYGADRSAGSPGGTGAPNRLALNTVLLRAPGDSAYRTLTAGQLDEIGTRFQGFVDVTTLVKAAGGGTYTVANVQSGTGPDRYAGWSLVVAYGDATQPGRNLTIFDGFQTVSTATPNVSVPVTGFRTPPVGVVRTQVGIGAYEGDRGSVGDTVRLDDTGLSTPIRPADNFFNSSITRLGLRVNDKDPDYDDQFGFDVAQGSTDGILANGDTSAVIRLSTKPSVGGESYLPGVVTFSTEFYAPRIEPHKTVTDLDGGVVEPGDVLEYTVRVPNDGLDGAEQVVLRDPMPDHATYVPGSLEGGALTDAAGDDRGEFDPTTNSVVVRLGTGASATAGGELLTGDSDVVTFRVRIDTPVAKGTALVNTARASFFTQTLGLPMDAAGTLTTAVRTPDLTLDKSHTGAIAAGRGATFHLAVRNAGGAISFAPATVSDVFDASFAVTAVSAPGWGCTTARGPGPGTTLTCTRADPLAAGASYPPIDVTVAVDPGAPAALANTASVDGGGDGDPANNTDTDATGVVVQANLAVTKTVSPARIPVGQTATYTITAVNHGPATATGVALTDPLPAALDVVSVHTDRGTCTTAVACALGALPVGATATVAVTVRGAAEASVANTAAIAAAQDDPAADDDRASATLDVVAAADLSITKTASPGLVDVGAGPAPITYTLTVHNAGPQGATAISVDDPVASELSAVAASTQDGTCTVDANAVHCDLDDLPGGADATVTITAVVPRTVPGTTDSMGGRTVLNGATVTGAPDDPDRANNSATTSTLVLPAADVEVTLVGPGHPVAPGDTATFTLDVVNHGPSTAGAVVATGTLPAGLRIVSVPANCAVAGQGVSCTLGTLAPGAAAQLPVVVRVDPAAPDGTVTADAQAEGDVPDPVPQSNRDAFSLTVASPAQAAPAPAASREPPATAGETGAPECLAGVVRLIDVALGARSVTLTGETGRANAGRTVNLLLAGRRVGTATVRADGTFRRRLVLPPRRLRSTNAARYRATLGTMRSAGLKLTRRMRMSATAGRGERVTIAGVVTGPRARPPRTVTLRRYADCTGRSFSVVRRSIRVTADGRFRVTVAAPARQPVAYYRATTRVRKTTRNARTYPTFTTIRSVAVRR